MHSNRSFFVFCGYVLGVCFSVSANRGGYPSFTDEIPFKINWPGADFSLVMVDPSSGALYKEDDFVIMTTMEKEKYKCLLPSLSDGDEDEEKEYSGPSPDALLDPLFKQSSCSYRLESYWTYEVCHGKHVRQYHEEKETGQKTNIQEYYLGTMAKTETESETEGESTSSSSRDKEVPSKNIEGQLTPYHPVGMADGTPCPLKKNTPRSTTVLYVCHPEAKHEILSIAEVTTCEYEVVVLTPLLCLHPKYRFKSSPVNTIFCQALAGSPLRPQRLSQLDQEQQELLKPSFGSASTEKEEEATAASPVREEAYTSTHKPMAVGGQTQVAVGTTHISRLTDEQLIKEFLSGSYCLHGGVGWWKYEFCYGRHVHQYHEDKEQGKSIVVVGNWNPEEHLEWAKKNAARSYQLREDGLQKVKAVAHFYGHGDVCDLTGKPRQVIVKLKCKESESPHAVTVYLLEPNTCQYILGVESPVICKILDTADENGLLSLPS